MILTFTPLPISEITAESFALKPLHKIILEKGCLINPLDCPLEDFVLIPRKHVIDNIIQFSERFVK